jgi:rhomboid protease GluP
MYVISLLLNPRATSLSANPLMFLSPNQQSLLLFGATGTLPIDQIRGSLFLDQFPRWWTLVSANYLHGGLLHIFFNMFALRQLAPLAIREYGNYRFFIIYTLGGIGGFWVSYLFGVTLTIGASAAIFGLVGSILYYAKSRGGPYGQVLYRQIGTWVIFLFIFGFVVPGINNFGHAGGLVAGIGLGILLGYQDKKKENLSHKFLAGICAALTVLLLGYAVIAGLIYRMLG